VTIFSRNISIREAMNRFKKYLRITIEKIKVPRHLLAFGLHLIGLYRSGFLNASKIQLQRYSLFFQTLPKAFDGLTIMVMGDFHIDSKLPLVTAIQHITFQVSADVLFFLGDYRYDITGPYKETLNRMQQVVESCRIKNGRYGILGNHDEENMVPGLEGMGIHMLLNSSVILEKNGERIYLIGVKDPHYEQADDLSAAMESVPAGAFTILLSHTAELYKQAAEKQIDFYLCGHTHGGQIASAKYGPIIKNESAPREFARGFWRYKNMTGYTTYGIGTSAVPVRFNAPPEIVLFTLKSKPESHPEEEHQSS